jgi:hypothetical protein
LSGSSKNSTKTTISTPLSIRSQNKQTNSSSPTTTATSSSSSSSNNNNNNKSQTNWPCVIASSIDEINCRPILHTTSAKLNHHQINPKRISVYKCNSIVGCAIKFLTEAIFDFKLQDQDKENAVVQNITTDILLNNETRRRPTKKKSLRVFTDSSFLMITNSSSSSSFNTHQQRLRFTRDIESNGVVPIKTNHDLINDLINRQLDARETVKSIYNLSSTSPAIRKQISSNKNLQASNKSLFNNNNNNNNIKPILISNSNSKIPYIDDDNDDDYVDNNNVEQVVLIEPSNQNLINIIQNNKRLNEYVDLITLSSTSTTTKSRVDFNYDNYNDQSQQQQQQQYDSNYLEDLNNFNNDNNNNRSLSLNILSKKLKSNSKQTTMSTSPNAIYKRPMYEHHHHHIIRHRGSNCRSDQYYDDYEFDYEFECINNEEILNFNFDNSYNYNDEVNGKSY